MPAINTFFTFNTKVKVNKKTVLEFVNEYEYYIRENFKDIKEIFNVDEINRVFLKDFIKELKNFDTESDDGDYVNDKKKIIMKFIRDILLNEERETGGLFNIRYLYSEYTYEAAGYDDHYYYTFIDDSKMIKKTIKEAEKLVNKLNYLGVDAKLSVNN